MDKYVPGEITELDAPGHGAELLWGQGTWGSETRAKSKSNMVLKAARQDCYGHNQGKGERGNGAPGAHERYVQETTMVETSGDSEYDAGVCTEYALGLGGSSLESYQGPVGDPDFGMGDSFGPASSLSAVRSHDQQRILNASIYSDSIANLKHALFAFVRFPQHY